MVGSAPGTCPDDESVLRGVLPPGFESGGAAVEDEVFETVGVFPSGWGEVGVSFVGVFD